MMSKPRRNIIIACVAGARTTQILQLLLSDLDICCQINATSTWLRVFPLLLGKFMPLSNTISWISVFRTIAYLDQLFQPVKTCSSLFFRCHLANALKHSSIKVYLSVILSLHRWLVAFSYTMCSRVSNVTKALISVNANPSQSSWWTLYPSTWTCLTTTIQFFGLPAVLGFLVSYALVSSPSTPTSIPTSTLLSAMSTLTLSTLRWTPFAKVAISTLVLRNIISAPWAPLPSIYDPCPWLNVWPTFHSIWIDNCWYLVFNPPSPLLGSLVATLVITSALAQSFQQPLMAYQITSSRYLANGPAMHIRSIFTLSSVLLWGWKPTHLTGYFLHIFLSFLLFL